MLRLIIAGSRNFEDYQLLESSLDEFIEIHSIGDPDPGVIIISGLAKGADLLGSAVCQTKGVPSRRVPCKLETGPQCWPQAQPGNGKIRQCLHCILGWSE